MRKPQKVAPWWVVVLIAPLLAYEWFWNAADQWSPRTQGVVAGACGMLSAMVLLCWMAMYSY